MHSFKKEVKDMQGYFFLMKHEGYNLILYKKKVCIFKAQIWLPGFRLLKH